MLFFADVKAVRFVDSLLKPLLGIFLKLHLKLREEK